MRHRHPTDDQVREWVDWLAARPAPIRAAVARYRIDPWTLYRLKTTGQRVFVLAFFEPGKDDSRVLCRVAVTGQFNVVAFERSVFGVDPGDLEECDLPRPDERVGALDLPVEVVKALREKYPLHLPPAAVDALIACYPLKSPGESR